MIFNETMSDTYSNFKLDFLNKLVTTFNETSFSLEVNDLAFNS